MIRLPHGSTDDAITEIGPFVSGRFADELIPFAGCQLFTLSVGENLPGIATEVVLGDSLLNGDVDPYIQPLIQTFSDRIGFGRGGERQTPGGREKEGAKDIALVMKPLEAGQTGIHQPGPSGGLIPGQEPFGVAADRVNEAGCRSLGITPGQSRCDFIGVDLFRRDRSREKAVTRNMASSGRDCQIGRVCIVDDEKKQSDQASRAAGAHDSRLR